MTTFAPAFEEPLSRGASRREGPLWGALRAVAFSGVVAAGMLAVERAARARGEAGAREVFAGIAADMAELLGLSFEVVGELDLEAEEVRVANHTSYLDILLASSVQAGRFLSRHDIADWPIVGTVATRIGTLYVDRDSHAGRATALRGLVRAARGGYALLVFPEGRTSKDGVLPFEKGAFAVARTAKVAVRPLAIRYSDVEEAAWVGDMTFLPHLWRRLSGPRVHARVIVLAAIPTAGRTPSDVAIEARAAIVAALARP